jgi:hypothetical protein
VVRAKCMNTMCMDSAACYGHRGGREGGVYADGAKGPGRNVFPAFTIFTGTMLLSGHDVPDLTSVLADGECCYIHAAVPGHLRRCCGVPRRSLHCKPWGGVEG